jgi:16S rRNA (guanine527-N7)-methyltransferase
MMERDILKQGLEQAKFAVTDKQIDQLIDFMHLVLDENQRMNLTAITDPKEFVQKHLLDSIFMWEEGGLPLNVLDLGTGGGFPGIPLKIMHPEWTMTLVDATKKKIRFLDHVVQQMNLPGVKPIHGRAEDLGREHAFRESYDLVFSRAVAPMNTLMEYCVPFVKVGGKVVAAKGPKVHGELEDAKNAMSKLGVVLDQVKEVPLAGEWGQRFIVVVQKVKTTAIMYPRTQGLPGKKPL